MKDILDLLWLQVVDVLEKQVLLFELVKLLHDYNPSYTNEDLLALYTYTGGVPKYIELFMDDGAYDKLLLKDEIY